MSAFNKVLEKIKNAPLNGHVLVNIQNVISLIIADKEIRKMLEIKEFQAS